MRNMLLSFGLLALAVTAHAQGRSPEHSNRDHHKQELRDCLKDEDVNPVPVPEPSTLSIFVVGGIGTIAVARRRVRERTEAEG